MSEKVSVFVKYSYEWKEDVPESERDTPDFPSRPFCKKLMELDRLYTRSDIENMSMHLGYSVFDRFGGDDCCHRWVRQTVVKKQS
jgi:hypothetical protein